MCNRVRIFFFFSCGFAARAFSVWPKRRDGLFLITSGGGGGLYFVYGLEIFDATTAVVVFLLHFEVFHTSYRMLIIYFFRVFDVGVVDVFDFARIFLMCVTRL